MKMIHAFVLFLFISPVLCLAGNDSISRTITNAEPSHGLQTLNLSELWRAGGEDEDVIFGRIVDIKRGPDGNTYVLDNQLCQVGVFSPEGEHLRDLSREGDGPGELRQPVELAFISDDILGIGMGFPGKVVTMKLDGTPDQSFFPIGVPSEGNIGLLMGFQYHNGVLAACGGRMVFNDTGQGHTNRFLSVCNSDCSETQHVFEKTTPIDLTGRQFVEATDYYIERSWVLGPRGLLYLAHERDSYEISVFDQTGKQLKIFGRQYQPRKRTNDEKDEVRPVINLNNNPDLEIIAEDYDPCISRILFNRDEGNLWVLTSNGNHDQPEKILETWDVFSVDGEYLKQVSIPLGNEMNDGTIYLVGNHQLVVVKGTGSAFNAGGGSDEDLEEVEVEPLEVICYEIR
jgi:hypothetical protein